MSKVLVSEENLTNIADSIRSKLDVETTYKPGQMSAAIDSIETGGGLECAINQYIVASDGNINAGDLVSYINQNIGTDTALYTGDYYECRAVALSDDKVLITYAIPASYVDILGMICTIDGTTITVGTPVTLLTSVVNSHQLFKLTDKKVFIGYDRSGEGLLGAICAIDGESMTVGTAVHIPSFVGVTLNDSKIFFLSSSGSSGERYLTGTIYTVDGTWQRN